MKSQTALNKATIMRTPVSSNRQRLPLFAKGLVQQKSSKWVVAQRVPRGTVTSFYVAFCHQENPLCNLLVSKYGHIVLRTKKFWIDSMGFPRVHLLVLLSISAKTNEIVWNSKQPNALPWFAYFCTYSKEHKFCMPLSLKSPSIFEDKLLCSQ